MATSATETAVRLSRAARALRAAHVAVAVVELVSLVYVWACVVTGRRDRQLGLAVGALAAEGAALVAGRGDCPLGPLQERIGDPVPLFEHVLPPRAAKAAVPLLTGLAVAGGVALLLRWPRTAR
jgi:hypothetical protein